MAKILVVDDDQDIVESLKTVLESVKHTVLTASSGEEGIKKAVSEEPDLIILDVMMESIDKGFEVSRRLKGSQDTKNTPILMLTAIKEIADMNLNARTGESSGGAAPYLPVEALYEKPIEPKELLRKVDSLLSKK
jgi:CheY-like chemotaxis protein